MGPFTWLANPEFSMMGDTLKKVLIGAVVIVVLLPVLNKYRPRPASFERAQAAFAAANLSVYDYAEVAQPALEAVAQVTMHIDMARVDLYRFDSEGKIAKQLEYQKKDAGSQMVEAWNIAQSLGAAPDRNKPTQAARNGKFMIVATGEDEELLKSIVRIFKSL